jgi:hypothetical protein
MAGLVPQVSGAVENPMSDRAIEDKFMANAAPVIGEERARQLAAVAWSLEGLADVRDIVKLCA